MKFNDLNQSEVGGTFVFDCFGKVGDIVRVSDTVAENYGHCLSEVRIFSHGK